MANLFIIGNGFDLAHGMKSSYNAFKKYLQNYCGYNSMSKLEVPHIYKNGRDCNDADAAKMLIKLISIVENGENWCDLENSLGHIDYSRFFDNDNMEEYNEKIAEGLEISILKIKYFFEKWITSLDSSQIRPLSSFKKFINIDKDYFLTFNYTALLENIYGAKKVCHVHGNDSGNIIFGHGVDHPLKLEINSKLKNEKGRLFNIREEDIPNNSLSYLTSKDIKRCLYEINFSDDAREVLLRNQLLYFASALKEKEKEHRNVIQESYTKWNNEYLDTIELHIQRIHTLLRKDTFSGLKNVISFINREHCFDIDKVYSIGFSYSDVDMKVIQLVRMFLPTYWYIDNYSPKKTIEYIKKLRKIYRGQIEKFSFHNL